MTRPTVTREKPILFNAEMVRAVLADKKTQTRRVLNPQPAKCVEEMSRSLDAHYWIEKLPICGEWNGRNVDTTMQGRSLRCKFAEGDVLYVPEGVIQIGLERTGRNGQYLWPKFDDEAKARRWFDSRCLYVADLKSNDPAWNEPHGRLNKMFMPRWAARILLEVESVRVERLQSISEEDAIAEGAQCPGFPASFTNRGAFAKLWDSLAKPGHKWADNPWCWAITFKRLA